LQQSTPAHQRAGKSRTAKRPQVQDKLHAFDTNEGSGAFAWPVDYVVCAALTIVSFLVLVAHYWFPPEKIFDEVYFARAAEEYLQRQYIYENTHPPVTKLLITLSTIAFGDNSYGWRFLDVVFGALAVWLLYALVKRVTGSTMFAAYGAGLLTLDGMHFVQSRIATPESFVVVFATASLYTFYRYWVESQDRAERVLDKRGLYKRAVGTLTCGALAGLAIYLRFPHESLAARLIAGICLFSGLYLVYRFVFERHATKAGLWLTLFALSLALLLASKWYGVMAFGVAFSVLVLVSTQRWWNARTPALWGNPRAFSVDVAIATVVFVVGAVYFASYTPQFIGLSDTPGSTPRSYTLTDVVNMQYNAFEYHDHLVATHPYQSRWWQWPLDLRPILYYAKYGTSGGSSTAAMIYTLPNPLILWLGLFTVPLIGYLAIKERNKGYLLIALTYIAQWLPWIGSPRISFAYHFYVNIPLICACTAIAAQRLYAGSSGSRRAEATWLIAGYFGATALAFVYFYPILSGTPIPSSAWMQRMWLHSWI
jgi:dolichyl-phosphate-mannose--protein O-mannosyl transferase